MSFKLAATKRTTQGPATRGAGLLPGVVYGAGSQAESVAINLSEFNKLYRVAGESTLIDFVLDNKEIGKVLVQDVQFDPVSDRVIHVDLRRIDMNKKMRAPVTLKFVGEAPVIKAQGGTLVTNLQTVEVECLPKDLVSNIEINIGVLNSFEDVIKVKDLVLPAGIKVLSPQAEDLVAKAARAMTEEEIKAMEEANASLDVSKIESAKPVKPEEGAEAAADGATAPAAADKAPEAKKEEKK